MNNVKNFSRPNNSEHSTLVIETWARLLDLYTWMYQHYGVEKIPTDWLEALFSLSAEDITRGWPRMKKEHPHTNPTPMGFVLVCQPKPEDVGFPDLEEAYQQAIGNNPNKHDAVAYTRSRMGAIAAHMPQMDDKQSRKIFSEYYLDVVAKVHSGELKIPKVICQSPTTHYRKTSLNLERHAECMAKMYSMFCKEMY